MKFYVAGKWQDRKNVRTLMDRLEGLGHIITYDWTIDKETDVGYPIVNTINDSRGVQVCDAYVGRFINTNRYQGALVEFGIALGLGKRILIIGHGADGCIFTNHPSVQHFGNEQDFLIYVRDWLR